MNNESEAHEPCLLATAWRSGRIESCHYGAVAVVVDGRLARSFGDPGARVFARSAVKPLQALPLLECGAAQRLGLDDGELALLSASHNGTPAHTEVVAGLLARGGFSVDDLQCGAHAPFDKLASLAIARGGGKPGRIHNNCSGKHAGFLLLTAELGAPAAGYLEPEGPAQQRVRQAVAEMAGLDPGGIDVGVDGCGAPTLGMPLTALARAFWRLANPAGLAAVRQAACARLLTAITRQPVLLAGRGRFCTALIESAPGRIYPKNGAEGVYAVGVTAAAGSPGFGLAVKVADGNERGYVPVVVQALHELGLWREVPAALEAFRRVPLRNTQKALVGHVESALAW